MTRLLKLLILIPVAIIVVVFSLANRESVTVVLDPSGLLGGWAAQIRVPLFFVVFASVMLGVIIGGCAAWLRQGKHRQAAREARSDARHARNEVEQVRAQFASLPLLTTSQRR